MTERLRYETTGWALADHGYFYSAGVYLDSIPLPLVFRSEVRCEKAAKMLERSWPKKRVRVIVEEIREGEDD